MSRFCACGCGASLDATRDGTLYASGVCRTAAHRANKRNVAVTGKEVLLRAFRETPGHELTNVELGRLYMTGGPQAFRSRISDLRKMGYTITTGKYVRRGVFRYKLLNPDHEPQPRAGQSDLQRSPRAETEDEQPTDNGRPEAADEKLFDISPPKHRPRGYGDPELEGEAA